MGPLGRHLVGIDQPRSAILHADYVGIGDAGAVIAAELDQFGQFRGGSQLNHRQGQQPGAAPLAHPLEVPEHPLPPALGHRLQQGTLRLRQALKLNPSFARAHYNLGLLLSSKNQPAEAITSLRRAEQLDPSDPGAPYARATIHYRLGDRAASLEAVQTTLTRDPSNVEALQLKAELQSR